jgi:hypothetical protein
MINNPLSTIVPDAVKDYNVIETNWLIKRWFSVDITRLQNWYSELIEQYGDWRWEYGKHKYMWKYDLQEKIGEFFQPSTAWIMLTWGNDVQGPVPWLRTIAKEEYYADMPRNESAYRECLFGYAKEIITQFPIPASDIQVAIHTPGTRLPQHQDSPDQMRFHIPIHTDNRARFVINGHDVHLPADGWVYLVNTSYLHETNNASDIDRVHIYGNVFTEDIMNLNLNELETFL